MENIFSYIKKYSNLSFNEKDFSLEDNLILSQFLYIDIANEYTKNQTIYDVILKKINNKTINKKLGFIVPQKVVNIAKAIYTSNRYRNIELLDYVQEISDISQFTACTYRINEDIIAITFSGTDDTISGWFEDFKELELFPTIAQSKAKDYINKIASIYDSKMYINGHSKGGCLATYASIYSDDSIKNRIIKCYSFDGQGLILKNLALEKFNLIKDKLIQITPKDSIIGKLFDNVSRELIVDSRGKGTNEHNPINWRFKDDHLYYINEHPKKTLIFNKIANDLLNSFTSDEASEFISELYNYKEALPYKTLYELSKRPFIALKKLNMISIKYREKMKTLIKAYIKYILL